MTIGRYPHKILRQFFSTLFFSSEITDDDKVAFTTSQSRYEFDKPIYHGSELISPPQKYSIEITTLTTEITVPTASMICSDTDLVFIGSSLLDEDLYTRVGNVYTFLIDLNAGDKLTFKK